MVKYQENDDFQPIHKHRMSPTKNSFTESVFLSNGITLSPLNPGNIANLHKKTRDIMPEWIEGLNLRCAANLDVNKTLCMEWLMGNNTPAGFRIGGMICRKEDGYISVSSN